MRSMLLGFCMLFLGCMTFGPTMNLNLQGNVKENWAIEMVHSSYEAYENLKSCEYLRQRHPAEYLALDTLAHNLTIIAMDPQELDAVEGHLGPVCGAAELGSNTILLNPYSHCDWTHTIAHEMLHCLGLDHPDGYGGEISFVLSECGLSVR